MHKFAFNTYNDTRITIIVHYKKAHYYELVHYSKDNKKVPKYYNYNANGKTTI